MQLPFCCASSCRPSKPSTGSLGQTLSLTIFEIATCCCFSSQAPMGVLINQLTLLTFKVLIFLCMHATTVLWGKMRSTWFAVLGSSTVRPRKALGDGLHAQECLFQKILFLFERMTDKLLIHDYLIFVSLKNRRLITNGKIFAFEQKWKISDLPLWTWDSPVFLKSFLKS